MTPAPIDIGSICQTAVDEMAAAHPSRDIHCHVEGKLAGCWDAGRIAQLLSNLIGNAIEHGTPDTPIWLSASSPSDSAVRVEVHNDGPPIPHERRRNLFEPLSRGAQDAAQSAQGHRSVGLGLYIASQIARAHGGTLELASSDEAGTTFALQLPRNLQLARAD
jgi:signal transduction histidine kinase